MLKTSIPWLEKLSKRIHKTMKPIPTIPEFLNYEEKWYKIVKETDTVENLKIFYILSYMMTIFLHLILLKL